MNRIQKTIAFIYTLTKQIKKSLKKATTCLTATAVLLLFFIHCTNQPLVAQISASHQKSCSNFVRIEGSSNVNKFYFEQDVPKIHFANDLNQHNARYIEFELPVEYFKASHPMMRNDFMELIKANDFPYISIFIELPDDNLTPARHQRITSYIKVKLAGHEKEYYLPSKVDVCKKNLMRLQGSLELDINDFNLTPPTKFMGMVKVNREVFIKFGLILNNNLLSKSD